MIHTETEYAQIYNDSVQYWTALGYTQEQAKAAAQHKIDCMKSIYERSQQR
jgi:hypothetical protein